MPEFTEFMLYYGKKKLKKQIGSKSMHAWGKIEFVLFKNK